MYIYSTLVGLKLSSSQVPSVCLYISELILLNGGTQYICFYNFHEPNSFMRNNKKKTDNMQKGEKNRELHMLNERTIYI